MLAALVVLIRTLGLICGGHRAVALENLARRRRSAISNASWRCASRTRRRRRSRPPPMDCAHASWEPHGHAHCRALLLPTSACLNVVDGRLALGRWQRVFLVELDGPRHREVSLVAVGESAR